MGLSQPELWYHGSCQVSDRFNVNQFSRTLDEPQMVTNQWLGSNESAQWFWGQVSKSTSIRCRLIHHHMNQLVCMSHYTCIYIYILTATYVRVHLVWCAGTPWTDFSHRVDALADCTRVDASIGSQPKSGSREDCSIEPHHLAQRFWGTNWRQNQVWLMRFHVGTGTNGTNVDLWCEDKMKLSTPNQTPMFKVDTS